MRNLLSAPDDTRSRQGLTWTEIAVVMVVLVVAVVIALVGR